MSIVAGGPPAGAGRREHRGEIHAIHDDYEIRDVVPVSHHNDVMALAILNIKDAAGDAQLHRFRSLRIFVAGGEGR